MSKGLGTRQKLILLFLGKSRPRFMTRNQIVWGVDCIREGTSIFKPTDSKLSLGKLKKQLYEYFHSQNQPKIVINKYLDRDLHSLTKRKLIRLKRSADNTLKVGLSNQGLDTLKEIIAHLTLEAKEERDKKLLADFFDNISQFLKAFKYFKRSQLFAKRRIITPKKLIIPSLKPDEKIKIHKSYTSEEISEISRRKKKLKAWQQAQIKKANEYS